MVLGRQEKVTFDSVVNHNKVVIHNKVVNHNKVVIHNQIEKGSQISHELFGCLKDSRQVMLAIIQDRSMKIEMRMCLVLVLSHDIQIRINKNSLHEIPRLLKRYQSSKVLSYLQNKIISYSGDVEKRFLCMRQIFRKMDRMVVLNPNDPKRIKLAKKNLYQNGFHEYKRNALLFEKNNDWEQYCEQLMVYYLFHYFLGAVYDEDAYTKVKLSIACTLFIKEMSMAKWIKKDGVLKFHDVVKETYLFAREVEHLDENIELLEKMCEKTSCFTLTNFISCILGGVVL